MFTVGGIVTIKESGAPVQGVVVALFDYDPSDNAPILTDMPIAGDAARGRQGIQGFPWQGLGQSLGSTVTNLLGQFHVSYEKEDFKAGDAERRADLVVVVLAPATSQSVDRPVSDPQFDRILHVTSMPRSNAGKNEAFVIRLLKGQLEKYDLQDAEGLTRPANFSTAASVKQSIRHRSAETKEKKRLVRRRLKEFADINGRIRARLAKFAPTALPVAVRESDSFLNVGENLEAKQSRILKSGLLARAAGNSRPLMNLTPKEVAALSEAGETGEDGSVEIDGSALLEIVIAPEIGTSTREFLLSDACQSARDTSGSSAPGSSDTETTGSQPDDDSEVITSALADEELMRRTLGQIQDMREWDPGSVNSSADPEKQAETVRNLKAMIDELKIAKGPADVTAIHDFHSVQLAWDHVWAEAYDINVGEIGQRALRSWETFRADNIEESEVDSEDPWLTSEDALNFATRVEEELESFAAAYPAPDQVNGYFMGLLEPAEFWVWLGDARQNALVFVAEHPNRVAGSSRVYRGGPHEGGLTTRLQVSEGGALHGLFEFERGGETLDSIRATVEEWRAQVRRWRRDWEAEKSARLHARPAVLDNDFGSWARVRALVSELKQRLKEPHAFNIFAPKSVNYGTVITYRQFWEPINYQVGELVGTIPLAPGERRQFTTRSSVKTSRLEKSAEESIFITKSESTITSRAESEILRRASLKSAFDYSTTSRYGGGNSSENDGATKNFNFGGGSNTSFGLDVEGESKRIKKNFRESVIKSAQEYRKNRKHELTTSTEETFETTTSGEVSNPNNEIPVTFLLYELQRQYEVSEKLHEITPVIFVAQDVPSPHEIDDDWLLTHDWILKRVLLDDQFRAAFDYLRDGFVGDNFTIEAFRDNWRIQRDLVGTVQSQLSQLVDSQSKARVGVTASIRRQADSQGVFEDIAELFTGGEDDSEAARARVEAAERALEFIQGDLADAKARLAAANDSLQEATRRLTQALQDQLNQRIAIDQLRVHIKENILYYMHAIWDHEVPDQRFMRLYDCPVPFPREPDGSTGAVRMSKIEDRITSKPGAFGGIFGAIRTGERPLEIIGDTGESDETAPPSSETSSTWQVEFPAEDSFTELWTPETRVGEDELNSRRLIEIADVGNPLGFWANYIILPLRKTNYITNFMARNYVDEFFGVWDPDSYGNFTTDELIDFMECAKDKISESDRGKLVDVLTERLQNPRRDKDIVVVPSDQLFIESLPGAHPVLEDFKLLHRAVDVQNALSDVREKEIDNLRRAWRLIEGERGDPEIDKQVRVDGSTDVSVDT